MMRSTSLVLAVSLLGLSGTVASAAGDEMNGVWMRDDGNARVRIAPCGSDICAVNLWIKDTSGGEEVGDKLVMTLKPEGEGKLTGKAYDAKRDKTFSMTVTVGKETLATRGCVLGQLLCKNVSWTQVKG